jgi:hypothetical protein
MLSPGKDALGHATYERHRPEQTLLYQLIEKHYTAEHLVGMDSCVLWPGQGWKRSPGHRYKQDFSR